MFIGKNPILPGFNPDPSIIYVDGYYYIATSTFQWYPGVQIHRSADLMNWELAARPLNSKTLLDMTGVPDSGGIWAPCLSHHEGVFYLIYTNTSSLDGIFKDTPNYLTTSRDISGPWSDPVFLNSSGFDPSLFHDEDGKKYLLNMLWDHRPWRNPFGGILLQEYSVKEKKLTGPIHKIFTGTELGCTEGPHLYKRGDFYYLLTAEGGTGFEHAETVARSKSITGPYEVHPANPLLTSRSNPDAVLQKAGHGDLIESPEGDWYLVHLCSRPKATGGYSVLGRETAIQEVEWKDGWPRLKEGGIAPKEEFKCNSNNLGKKKVHALSFSPHEDLPIEFQWLRTPGGIKENRNDRPGWLRLIGGNSLTSRFNASLLGIRIDSIKMSVEVSVDFEPEDFQQMAGLAAYYDTRGFFWLHIAEEEGRRVLHLLLNQDGRFSYPLGRGIELSEGIIRLKGEFIDGYFQFYYAGDGEDYIKAGDAISGEALSDDYGTGWRFTGAFWAIAVVDLTGRNKWADFIDFQIRRGDIVK